MTTTVMFLFSLLLLLIPTVNILILTTFDDDTYVSTAIGHGAKGYLLKDTPSEEIAAAIRAVDRGYTHLAPGMMAKVMAGKASEAEVKWFCRWSYRS